jgi:cytoskeletal protein CcmA (bactofilin family)
MPDPEATDDQVRCPHCKTTRLKVLPKLDRIEKVYGNAIANRVRANRGDTIYHCVFCRLQFYDSRKPGRQTAPEANRQAEKPPSPEKSEPEPARIEVAPAPAPAQPVAAAPVSRPAPPEQPGPPVNGKAVAVAVIGAGTNLSAGVSIRGSIHSEEDIYVDGRVDGTVVLKQNRLTIGKNAMVKAGIRAAEIDVRGSLHGNSHTSGRMLLRAGSKVLGDIKAGDIEIEDGAQFKGAVELVREQPRLPLE